MILAELLKFVTDNAVDVADLAKVHEVKKLDSRDPWYKVLVRELRQKYEDRAIEADRASLFD